MGFPQTATAHLCGKTAPVAPLAPGKGDRPSRSPGSRVIARSAFPGRPQWHVDVARRSQLRGQPRSGPRGRSVFPFNPTRRPELGQPLSKCKFGQPSTRFSGGCRACLAAGSAHLAAGCSACASAPLRAGRTAGARSCVISMPWMRLLACPAALRNCRGSVVTCRSLRERCRERPIACRNEQLKISSLRKVFLSGMGHPSEQLESDMFTPGRPFAVVAHYADLAGCCGVFSGHGIAQRQHGPDGRS